MSKVGIICAGDCELEPFLPHLENVKISKKAMLKFYVGQINGLEVITLFSGVCKTNAAIAAQVLIDHFGADIIINAGTAGGMDQRLEIFDTVIATEAAYYDMDENILTAFHPWMDSIYFKSDQTLLDLAKEAVKHIEPKGKVYFGRMITGEKFIIDESRDEINAVFNPLSVDMETASIAHVCYVNKIPFIAIRCVTDTATHSGAEYFEKNYVAASGIAKNIVLQLLTEIKDYYNIEKL